MDRLISDEERIRRAEDVLERRKNTNLRISGDNFSKSEPNSKFRKMLIQILICLLIYCGMYYVKNSQNDNLKNIISKINGALEYDVNFSKIYADICAKFNNINEKINKNKIDSNEKNQETQDEQNTEQNEDMKDEKNSQNSSETVDENNQDSSENIDAEGNNLGTDNMEQSEEQNLELGIGGSTEDLANQTEGSETEEDEMKSDAEYIKNNFSIIKPLSNYVVTSRFGIRNSNEIVSANHRGIDLGDATGTSIVAAMEGTVIEASSTGDFGLHLKIENNDVVIIYAHCSELLVKEGDKVNQGMEIAKVGSTGKATGPHLHFEIRRSNRAVNPEYILQF